MAIGDAYISTIDYRAVIGKTTTGEDAEELLDLKAVARYLERKLGRFFNVTVAAQARVYYPQGRTSRDRRMLYVDDMAASPTSIKVDTDLDGSFADETAFASTDFELLPLNADLEPETQPWIAIRIPSWSTQDLWKAGYPVQIITTWGWPAVPGPLARANAHITAILRLETPRATLRIPEAVDNAADANPKIRDLVAELALSYARPARLVFS